MTTSSLPRYPTSFIGRETEIDKIVSLLHEPACRLLTLTGPGGIGKTRLAVEVTRRMIDDHESGQSLVFAKSNCFVPLQPLTSSDSIVSAIANALHISFRGELAPKQQLLVYLREKRLLLVLDNFEHVMAGVGLLPDLLDAAPNLTLLVTSRERLRLREEWVFDVGGLTVPQDVQSNVWDDFTAVQLFLQSARRAGYEPAETDSASIMHICQAVEGIPLAVELAAGWTRIMSCADIALEIVRGLDILTTTTRNVPDKHRSIHAAFEHSWELLMEDERAAFSKLSVFRGGFTRESAEQVAGATLPILAGLVDKSLVQVDATGRYDLHELLRQFAAEKLADVGNVDAAIQHHIDYFLSLAEGAEAHAFGGEQVAWFDHIEIEFDNLRAALTWSLETETGLQIAAALGWFFTERGYWYEGLEWLKQALEANPAAPDTLRAKAYHCAAASATFIAFGGGNAQIVLAYCEQALILARATNDRWNIAWALSHSATGPWIDQPAARLDESIALFRELNDEMGLAHTLLRRAGYAAKQRNFATARRLLDETSRYAHAAGDRVILAWVNSIAGKIYQDQDHDLDQARTHCQTALSLFREAHVAIGIDVVLRALAEIEAVMGNMAQAQHYSKQALISEWTNMPDSNYVPGDLLGLAHIARALGQVERAAILLGAVHSGWADDPIRAYSFPFDDDKDAVRAQLGKDAFNRVLGGGSSHDAPTSGCLRAN